MAIAVVSGCSLGEPAPPPAPDPILEGAPIREGVYTRDEARTAARLLMDAEGLLAGGRLDEAIGLARRVETSYATVPGSSGALWLRARALHRQEAWSEAVAVAEAYAELMPAESVEYGEAYLLRAAARRDGDLPGGIEALFDIPPATAASVLERADSLAAVWAAGLETTELRDLILEAPRHPRVLPVFATELSIRRYLSGDETEARALAEQALSMSPGESVRARARSVVEGTVEEDLEVAAVLGGILPMEGSPSNSRLARELSEGVEVALIVDEQDFARPVRFVPIEDADDPEEMADALRRLVEEGAAAVIGPLQDASVAAAARSRSGPISILSPTATLVPSGAQAVFSLTGVDPAAAEALADLVVARGGRQAVVIHAAAPEAEAEFGWFRDAFTERGGALLRVLTYPPGATGFQEQMAAVIRLRPQALVLILPPEDVQLVAPQIAFYGVDALPGLTIFGSASWTSENVLQSVQARTTEGVFSVTSWVAEDEFGPGWDAFVVAYEEYFQRSLRSPTPALGYDAARLLLRAAREGGGTPEGTLRALERIRGFPGATGLLSVVDGRIRRSYVPVRIENRRLVLVAR